MLRSTSFGPLAAKIFCSALRIVPLFLILVWFLWNSLLAGFAERRIHVPPPSSVTQISPSIQRPEKAVIRRRSLEDVMVNNNPATLLLTQTEPSIASNPSDFRQLVAGFADQSNGDFAPGVSISPDGGGNWSPASGGAVLPDPPGFTWGVRALASNLAGGDAAVVWGLGNTVFFSTL